MEFTLSYLANGKRAEPHRFSAINDTQAVKEAIKYTKRISLLDREGGANRIFMYDLKSNGQKIIPFREIALGFEANDVGVPYTIHKDGISTESGLVEQLAS
jgi:hypothetical protein